MNSSATSNATRLHAQRPLNMTGTLDRDHAGDPSRCIPSARLRAGAVAMLAPGPAAGPPLARLQLLLRPADATFSCRRLLGILDPADELVARQGRDVLPRIEGRRVGEQHLAQVGG